MKDITTPALEAVFEAGILETSGKADGAARLGGLGTLVNLGVESQDARGETDGVGVAAEVDAGGCCGSWGRGSGSGFLGRGGGAGRLWVSAAASTTAMVATEAKEAADASNDAAEEATESADVDSHTHAYSHACTTRVWVWVRFRVG